MSSTSLESKIENLENHLIDKVPSLEDRVPLIQELLKTKQELSETAPIPDVLIEKDWSQDEVATSEQFVRGIIQTFRDNDVNGWHELIDSCTEKQGQILVDFASGAKIDDLYERFDFGSTRGTRKELAELENAEKTLVPIPLVNSNLDHNNTEANVTTNNGEELLNDHTQPLAPQPQFHALQKSIDVQLFEDPGHKKKLTV